MSYEGTSSSSTRRDTDQQQSLGQGRDALSNLSSLIAKLEDQGFQDVKYTMTNEDDQGSRTNGVRTTINARSPQGEDWNQSFSADTLSNESVDRLVQQFDTELSNLKQPEMAD